MCIFATKIHLFITICFNNKLNINNMCGFVGAFEFKVKSEELRPQVLEMSKKIRHRGPDWSGIYCGEKAILAHEIGRASCRERV